MARIFTGGGWWGALIPFAILGAVLIAVLRSTSGPEPSPTPVAATVFVPVFERLPPVSGGHYELWFEHPDGGAGRVAAFTVLPRGALFTLTGEPVQDFLVTELPPLGSTLLLTVEPGETPVEKRSARVLLRGALQGLEVTFEPVLPDVGGKHVAMLVAPTDAKAPDTTGVWFVRPAGGTDRTSAGLQLKALGEGWAYGGFLTTSAGTVLYMGLFPDPKKADGSVSFSGSKKGLPFPGEDFVRNPPEGVKFPLNLADGRTTVTVSLEPDFSKAIVAAEGSFEPFLPLLTLRIPYQQKPGEAFTLSPVSPDTFPGGTGKFEQRTL
ncbi:MAG: hypothetical protein G01um101438_436 [Parcubacteria group bacterium Gr01-1014_38]|nr:MAG: hypothetical protein G01um101438_436 [Parcubacteria group bacterium Gr01-1014_38]